ncbi:hypothetical protein MUG91_G261n4 [Manis pentadactyla]|nr:hypothetical protein MUG91_G261n4 [Manis pentadactyla]
MTFRGSGHPFPKPELTQLLERGLQLWPVRRDLLSRSTFPGATPVSSIPQLTSLSEASSSLTTCCISRACLAHHPQELYQHMARALPVFCLNDAGASHPACPQLCAPVQLGTLHQLLHPLRPGLNHHGFLSHCCLSTESASREKRTLRASAACSRACAGPSVPRICGFPFPLWNTSHP